MKPRYNMLLLAFLAGWSVAATETCVAASCNSVVRYQIRYGTTLFGVMDVELFDFEKPVTVSNFLHHVRSGAYDRSFLHRLVPNFILQGGLYSVENPYTSTLFSAMTRIPEGRPITNEFNRGARISNTFGTLAMALSATNIGGNYYPVLDSATTSWFFNTVDNTDQLDPNYAVFGRVIAGSEHLTYFNTFSEDSGIINMSGLRYLFSACDFPNLVGEGQVAFNSLPVAYFFFDCPYYSDLFNVQITVIKLPGDEVCLNGPERIGGQFRWSFATKEGYNYDVQHADDLNTKDWRPLRTIIGDGMVKFFSVSPTGGARFFRVVRR